MANFERRAVLTHGQFFKLGNWLRSKSKDGKIIAVQRELAIEASKELGFPIVASSLSKAATVAEILIERPRNSYNLPGGNAKRVGRSVQLGRAVYDLMNELENCMGGKFVSDELRARIRRLSWDRGATDLPTPPDLEQEELAK